MKKLIVPALLNAFLSVAFAQTVHAPSAASAAPSAASAAASAARIATPSAAAAPAPAAAAIGAGGGTPPVTAHPLPHAHPACQERPVWFCEHASNCYWRTQKDC